MSKTQLALDWWNSLSLEDKQNKTFYYCTGNEIGVMQFEIEHIVEIWTNEFKIQNQPN